MYRCRPMTESIGKAKYILTFIDDFLHYIIIYFIQNKSNVFNCFIKFKAYTEMQTGNKLKILQSDNRGEYISDEFSNYLAKFGIMHETTVPDTLEQNRVKERFNRILMESV